MRKNRKKEDIIKSKKQPKRNASAPKESEEVVGFVATSHAPFTKLQDAQTKYEIAFAAVKNFRKKHHAEVQ